MVRRLKAESYFMFHKKQSTRNWRKQPTPTENVIEDERRKEGCQGCLENISVFTYVRGVGLHMKEKWESEVKIWEDVCEDEPKITKMSFMKEFHWKLIMRYYKTFIILYNLSIRKINQAL